jgi:hypothetical protein
MSTGVSGETAAVPPDDPYPLWPDLSALPPEPAGEPHVPAQPAEPPAEPGESTASGSTGLGVVAVVNRRPVRPPASPRPSGRSRRTRRPAVGLAGMLLFALLAAFVAGVTAEPVWLALGHAQPGTVTVTKCTDGRCRGTFTGAGFTRTGIPVMGAVPAGGATAAARMTSVRGARAYVDVDARSRAGTGLALLLLCGAGTAWATGTRRLPTRRTRLLATLASLVAPLVLLAGMLATTF